LLRRRWFSSASFTRLRRRCFGFGVVASASASLVRFGVVGSLRRRWFASASLVRFGVVGSLWRRWFSLASLVLFGVVGSLWRRWLSLASLVLFGVVGSLWRRWFNVRAALLALPQLELRPAAGALLMDDAVLLA
jgi:hypothetical protein